MLLGQQLMGVNPAVAGKALAAGAVFGFLFGVAAHLFLFNYSEAVTVIEIGHVNIGDKINGETNVSLESVDNLSERVRGRTFNAEVAKRTGNTDAEQILSGFRYGGGAGLSTRTIWSTNQIEIRVRAKDDLTALKLANGVVDTIAAQHNAMFDELAATLSDRVKALQQWLGLALNNKRTVDQKIAESKDAGTIAIFLIAGQQGEMEIARQTAILEDARSNLLPPNSARTRNISHPSLAPRILASAASMGATGLVAGLCLAFFVLLLRPRDATA